MLMNCRGEKNKVEKKIKTKEKNETQCWSYIHIQLIRKGKLQHVSKSPDKDLPSFLGEWLRIGGVKVPEITSIFAKKP